MRCMTQCERFVALDKCWRIGMAKCPSNTHVQVFCHARLYCIQSMLLDYLPVFYAVKLNK
eukprot:scaffold7194_cov181-Ochromonas_danica.AAC.7